MPEIIINNRAWSKFGEKEGGARPSGDFGGVYKSGNNAALVKQDNYAQDIAEFLGARIHNATVPNHSPELHLARIPESVEGAEKSDSNVYLVSVFFDNYKDLYKDIYVNEGEVVPKDRPRAVGSIGDGKSAFRKGLKCNGYTGFPEVMVTSLLIGDFDVHWGNIGVVRNPNQDPKLVRIDFGAAFNSLKGEIAPHSISQHLPGFGPTNHFREFPREMKLNDNFIKELERVAKIDLSQAIDNAFEELESFYSPQALKQFGERLGVTFNDDNNISTTIKNHLSDIIKERQTSLKNFATELKIDLCISKDAETGEWTLDNDKFEHIIHENPKYFEEVCKGERKINLYDLNHKDTWNLFSSNPDAASLKRVFIAIASAINKILPEFMQLPTNETAIEGLIKSKVNIMQQPNKHDELTDNKKISFVEKIAPKGSTHKIGDLPSK
jgi:hypothetical protein